MRVILCQLDIAWENRQENFDRVEKLLRSSVPPRGSLLGLPEMFSTGFSMNVAATREAEPSLTERFVQRIAREFQIHVIAGVVGTGTDQKVRNDAILVSPEGEEVGRYSKMHPFTLGGEAANYAAGVEVATLNIRGIRLAPFICYDLRFPEVFRKAAKSGVDVYCVIANWPCAREHHWVSLLVARAIENQAYVIGVNRTGSDPQLEYPGRSMVISPGGEIILDAGRAEGIFQTELNFGEMKTYREKLPFLADMKFVG